MFFIGNILLKVIDIYQIIILASVVLSWIDRYGEMSVTKFIRQLTDPYLNKLKVVVPVGGMYFDLSPIIGILLLNVIRGIVVKIFFGF
ncbi:YggT family protein [Sebaldella sp. S0638]|uniref:YggT family protein n=1 Tax=Sebaldella sp. S0638 TaxID=2957809 RepID=UPI0020A01684|nr:YggT family protein [Sebaldella sp. S0638]MCP1222899.1 YggT family protein [Sebaldella sp. S0638]